MQARVDVGAAVGDRLQRGAQLALRALLERVAARAGVQAADQQVDLVGARVEHDPPLRVGVDQLRGQLDARLLAEPDVDQRDVRVEPLDQLAALVRGARGAQHFDPVASEQQLEALAEGLVILDQHKAERHVDVSADRTD